jgi:hypothetical protein
MNDRRRDKSETSPTSLSDAMTRATLIRKAFLLEGFAWMTIEAAVAIGAGIAAHSLLLLAFGIDSVIELASGTRMEVIR